MRNVLRATDRFATTIPGCGHLPHTPTQLRNARTDPDRFPGSTKFGQARLVTSTPESPICLLIPYVGMCGKSKAITIFTALLVAPVQHNVEISTGAICSQEVRDLVESIHGCFKLCATPNKLQVKLLSLDATSA